MPYCAAASQARGPSPDTRGSQAAATQPQIT